MAINAASKSRPPRRAKAAPGDNSLTDQEKKTINASLKELIAIKHARETFNTKMKNRANKAKSPLRDLNMDMGEVDAYVASMIIEQGKDDDAAKKAELHRARKLDTHRRLHAATHEGEQLDWVDISEKAEAARATDDAATEGKGGDEEEEDEGEE